MGVEALMDPKQAFSTIDEYIAQCAPEIRERLVQIRELIRRVAPEASEKISYQMPTFYLHGNLIHFAAFKEHIGLYPTPSAVTAFDAELARYQRAKGSIRLPLDEPLPLKLIERIVAYRVAEVETEESERLKKKAEAKKP